MCIGKGITTATGLQSSVVAFFGMLLLGCSLSGGERKKIFQKQMNGILIIRVKGYGTAGYMKPEEQKEILNADQNLQDVLGIIFGKDLESGEYVVSGRCQNRNLGNLWKSGKYEVKGICKKYGTAVCAAWRVHACYLRIPNSELYEDLAGYLSKEGYVVKQLNLIDLVNSDAWDCLGD